MDYRWDTIFDKMDKEDKTKKENRDRLKKVEIIQIQNNYFNPGVKLLTPSTQSWGFSFTKKYPNLFFFPIMGD